MLIRSFQLRFIFNDVINRGAFKGASKNSKLIEKNHEKSRTSACAIRNKTN